MSFGGKIGEFDVMTMIVADLYEDEVEQAIKVLTSFLNPLIIMVIVEMISIIPIFKIFNAPA
ncbi:type II secretion system F family protein [cyanobacterium endosymbiont of Epithemia clementina EcSB]|uniref:type II secretion system F family protein n=1 Tax=cyanobacterium endosymbiont of Epithemia clementina EcSB TaxID=3034674 RepID=UPI003867D60A